MSENKSGSDNLKHALCYAPFVAIILFFTESKKSDELMKHMKYWFSIFVIYIVLNIFLSWAIWSILFLLYVWITAFLWYKAYSWEKVEIEYIDKLEWKIKENMKSKDESIKNKENPKK